MAVHAMGFGPPRPFPPGLGAAKIIVVGVDYFTKWVEAEPLATITEWQIEKFVWRNLVTRFGLPKTIITDNGPQFAGKRFREFCANHGIQLRFSSVAYPSDKRAGRGNQSVHPRRAQKKGVRGPIGLDGRTPERLMVAAHHSQDRDRRVPLQPRVRNRNCPTARSSPCHLSDRRL
uniref:Integrase catalytic domain-containing protein n=1 Tax=Musa acuminata subsp. malaccensis TaxID=214687 RepID=A0A804KN23_MUSAM|nr:PREDICTED: uncharacterized protein LOC103998981 [Musa acuminata subsp. malaccensis]